MAVAVVVKTKVRNHRSKFIAGGLLIIAIVAGALIYLHRPHTTATQETELSNAAFMKGDKALALEHAKKALAKDPNNVDTILLVANLTKAQDPAAAKKYYVEAFNKFKQQNDPDAPGKSAITYWAAAGLARQAGEISQAKKYYEMVIKAADPSDGYQQSLAQQSKAELARLK